MPDDPALMTQLARILQDPGLLSASPARAREVFDRHMDLMVAALLEEAAASDDVYDHDSALAYVQQRLRAFAAMLDPTRLDRLHEALREKIDAW